MLTGSVKVKESKNIHSYNLVRRLINVWVLNREEDNKLCFHYGSQLTLKFTTGRRKNNADQFDQLIDPQELPYINVKSEFK